MKSAKTQKNLYLYKGYAFRQDRKGRLWSIAADKEGNPVFFEMYCKAKSPVHAANLFKFRLLKRYGDNGEPIKLLKKYMFIEKEKNNEEVL